MRKKGGNLVDSVLPDPNLFCVAVVVVVQVTTKEQHDEDKLQKKEKAAVNRGENESSQLEEKNKIEKQNSLLTLRRQF